MLAWYMAYLTLQYQMFVLPIYITELQQRFCSNICPVCAMSLGIALMAAQPVRQNSVDNYINIHEQSVNETRKSKATTPEDNSFFFKRRKRRAASGRT